MSEQQKGARLERKIQDTVTQRATSVPHPQPLDANVSGYKHLPAERFDLDGMNANQRTRIGESANRSRISALQGQQSLANFTTMLPEDFQFYLQKQLVDPNGVVAGVGLHQIGENHPFWEYASKKEALRMQAEFEKFKLCQINLRTPESRAYWEKNQPELTKKLREGLRQDRAAKARIEDIGLYGVQDEKDLWLLYERERGFSRNPLGTIQSRRAGIYGERETYIGEPHDPDLGGGFSVPGNIIPTVPANSSGNWMLQWTPAALHGTLELLSSIAGPRAPIP